MSRLLINEPPLQVLPSLAVKIGLQEAIVLQQVHYWLQAAKPKNGERWVYNTYEQWAEQFPFWSPEAIRKIFKSLRDQGLIISRPRGHHAFDRVNEYTINGAALEALHPEKSTGSCGECIPDEPEKFTASERTNLPATRQETTQETTSERSPSLPTVEKVAKDASAPSAPECPHAEILKLWAHHCPTARQPAEWNAARQAALRRQWRSKPARSNLNWWSKFFAYVAQSDFLMGRTESPGRKPFEVSLDWLLKSANFLKVIEGAYENKEVA